MKKKLILFLILIIFLMGSSISYAYFINKNEITDSGEELTFDPTLSKISVYEEGFYKYINNYYLSTSGVLVEEEALTKENVESENIISDKYKRFTLSLLEDITLKNNIVISSDCHIDLNGKKIDLNGYQIAIRNLYEGTMIIFDSSTGKTGSVTDTSKLYNIVVDCPRGNVVLPNINNLEHSKFNVSEPELANSAMKYVLANLQNAGVNDFYNIVKEDIDPIETRHCVFHGASPVDSADGCIYTYTDLQLINNYFNNDKVKITYNFSDNTYISENGNVTLPTTTTDVTLTVTVTVGQATPVTKNVIVHLVSPGDYQKAVVASVIEYLNYYSYYEDGEFVRYHLHGPIELPMIDLYFGSSSSNIIYNLYSANDTTKLITSSSSPSDYFKYLASGTSLTMGLNSSVKYMSITYGSYTSPLLPIEGTSKSMIIDNYSYALGIVRENYGESIKITKNGNTYNPIELYLSTHNDMQKYDRLESVKYSVVNDTDYVYTIEPAGTGETIDELKVIDPENNPPNITQTPLLNMEFIIKNPDGEGSEKIVLQIPIELSDGIAGSGVASFAQYYAYFDKEFKANSNNHTYHDFELPISFGSKFPIYQFKIYQVTQTQLNDWGIEFDKDGFLELNETKSNATTGYNGLANLFTSETNILNDGLFTVNIYQDTNSVSMSAMKDNASTINTIVSTGLGRTFIDINQYLIPQEDTYYIFFYQPCETVEVDSTISLNIENTYDYFSLLTIPGIVRFESTASTTNNVDEKTQTTGTEAFADMELYKHIWELYSDEEWNYEDTAASKKYGNNFILSSRLDTYVEVLRFNDYQTPVKTTYGELKAELAGLQEGQNLSLKTVTIPSRTTSISNFKGIELLDGVEALYLCGVDVGTSNTLADILTGDTKMQIEYIAGMAKLKVLDLSHNGLTDRPEGLADNLKFPTGTDNQFISKLSTLTNLEFLFLNNNYFYSFAGVESLSTLKYVNIKDNKFKAVLISETSALYQYLSFINDLLTTVINSIYGSDGATNIGYFAQLQGLGTQVYEYSSGGTTDTRVQSMMAIEYQNKLAKGIDISNVYNALSEDINDYAIPENYVISDSNGNVMSGITLRTDITEDVDDPTVTGIVSGIYFKFSPVGDDPTLTDKFSLTLTYYMNYHRDGSLLGGETIDQNFKIKYYVEYKVTRY